MEPKGAWLGEIVELDYGIGRVVAQMTLHSMDLDVTSTTLIKADNGHSTQIVRWSFAAANGTANVYGVTTK